MRRWIFGALILVLFVVSCGESATPTPVPDKAIPAGEVISVTATLADMGFDSALVGTGFWIPYHHEIFDFPLDQNQDGSIKPRLAKSWKVSGDQMTWTFEMQEDVKFHNGMSFTAEDAAWSFNRTFDPERSGSSAIAFAKFIDEIYSEGNKVIWKSTEPDAAVPIRLGSWESTFGAIQSKEYFNSVDIETFRSQPVGTGPYKFAERVFGQYVKGTAFNDHWDKSRVPFYPEVTVMVVPELSTRLALLKTGGADLVEAGMPAIKEIQAAGYEVVTSPGAQTSNIWCAYNYDWQDPSSPSSGPCGDLKVRRAISLAIDRDAIGNALYFGLTDTLKAFRTGIISIGYPHDLEPEPYNADLAKNLLAEAGFGPQNQLSADIFTYVGDADWPDQPTFAEAIAGYLGEVGINTKVRVIDWTLVEENTAEYHASGGGYPQGENQLSLLLRGDNPIVLSLRKQMSEYYCVGNPNPAVCDDNVNRMLEEMQGTFDLDEYAVKMKTFNTYMYENYLTIPVLTGPAIFAISDKVGGWAPVAGFSMPHNHWSLKP